MNDAYSKMTLKDEYKDKEEFPWSFPVKTHDEPCSGVAFDLTRARAQDQNGH